MGEPLTITAIAYLVLRELFFKVTATYLPAAVLIFAVAELSKLGKFLPGPVNVSVAYVVPAATLTPPLPVQPCLEPLKFHGSTITVLTTCTAALEAASLTLYVTA